MGRAGRKLTQHEVKLIDDIAYRAVISGYYDNLSDAFMDLTAVHTNGNPLRLADPSAVHAAAADDDKREESHGEYRAHHPEVFGGHANCPLIPSYRSLSFRDRLSATNLGGRPRRRLPEAKASRARIV